MQAALFTLTSADARLTAVVKRIIYGASLCLRQGNACFVPFCPLFLSSKLIRAGNYADTVARFSIILWKPRIRALYNVFWWMFINTAIICVIIK